MDPTNVGFCVLFFFSDLKFKCCNTMKYQITLQNKNYYRRQANTIEILLYLSSRDMTGVGILVLSILAL